MREIKFRAWDSRREKMYYFDLRGYMSMTELAQEEVCPASANSKLMQFTGLRDKNGKEIYEEDILETRDDDGSFYLKVIYDEEGARYWFVTDEDFYAPDELDLDEILVIGNIYENPELLQAG